MHIEPYQSRVSGDPQRAVMLARIVDLNLDSPTRKAASVRLFAHAQTELHARLPLAGRGTHEDMF